MVIISPPHLNDTSDVTSSSSDFLQVTPVASCLVQLASGVGFSIAFPLNADLLPGSKL